MPYQRSTFVTPAFPGYVSGHSTFSRAAAEVMAAITGDAYFPGGLSEYTLPRSELLHEEGPTADTTLQWATYFDAADQAGVSRIYMGIHITEDDFNGRRIGSACGQRGVGARPALLRRHGALERFPGFVVVVYDSGLRASTADRVLKRGGNS